MNGGGIPWPKAWTISGVTGSLGAADFVAGVVEQFGAGLQNFLPAVIFVIAVLLFIGKKNGSLSKKAKV